MSLEDRSKPGGDGFIGPDRLVGEEECKQMSGDLSRTTRWRMERRGEFPKRRQLSPGRVGWSLRELVIWGESRPQVQSDAA